MLHPGEITVKATGIESPAVQKLIKLHGLLGQEQRDEDFHRLFTDNLAHLSASKVLKIDFQFSGQRTYRVLEVEASVEIAADEPWIEISFRVPCRDDSGETFEDLIATAERLARKLLALPPDDSSIFCPKFCPTVGHAHSPISASPLSATS